MISPANSGAAPNWVKRFLRWINEPLAQIEDERFQSIMALVKNQAVVYFLQNQNDPSGPVKIGYTADLKSRTRTVEIRCSHSLRCLGVIRPGSYQIEAELHRQFRPCRVRGEWFAPVPEFIEFIKQETQSLEQYETETAAEWGYLSVWFGKLNSEAEREAIKIVMRFVRLYNEVGRYEHPPRSNL